MGGRFTVDAKARFDVLAGWRWESGHCNVGSMVRVVQGAPAPRRPALRSLVAIAAVIAAVAHTEAASAQQGGERPPEAVEFYQRGRALYQQGRYQEAVVELERALMLDPGSANLVFNCARVYELLGDLDRSIDYYSRYRAMLPQEQREEAERTESTIHRLEGARRAAASRPRNTPPPEIRRGDVGDLRDPNQPFTIRQTGVADEAFWATAVTSTALLVAGAITGMMSLSQADKADSFVLWYPGDEEMRQTLMDEAETLAIATDVLLSLGAIGAIVSTVLYFARDHEVEVRPSDATRASVGTDLRGVWLDVRGAL